MNRYAAYPLGFFAIALFGGLAIAQAPQTTVGGIYQATPPTLSDKQIAIEQIDVNGKKLVTTSAETNTAPSTAPAKAVVAGALYNTIAPTFSDGQTGALRIDAKGRLIQTVEKRATYSAAIAGLVPQAAATDIFCIAGSATKTIVVKHISFGGTATALGAYDMLIVRRSTANTGGTSTTPTTVLLDTTNAAGTAAVAAYTANPTLGTLVGLVDAPKFSLAAATGQVNERARSYGQEEDQGIVLRGAAEQVCLNFNAQTAAGNSINIEVEWREIIGG